jgi:hypothetical protein
MSKVVNWKDNDAISEYPATCMMIWLDNGWAEINNILYAYYVTNDKRKLMVFNFRHIVIPVRELPEVVKWNDETLSRVNICACHNLT